MTDLLNLKESFNLTSEIARERAALLERDDLNHAIAGADVGRMRKHLSLSENGTNPERKGTDAERVARTLQWLLLNDVAYAHAHKAAVDATNDAMDATARALVDVNAALDRTSANIEDILNRAAKLPDGRKVFRHANGNVVDREGNAINSALADGILWRGDEPTYDEYHAATDRADDLVHARDELLGIEIELGGYQNEMNDDESPASVERLDTIKDRSDALRDRVTAIQSDLDISPAANAKVSSAENIPDVTVGGSPTIPTIGLGG